MSRRHAAAKRKVFPDPKHGNVVLSKFMNCLMKDGKKSVAESIVYGALDSIEKRYKVDSLQVFSDAIDNVMPAIEVRSRRVGGATYQVPVEVRKTRALALAIRWIIAVARKRSEKEMQHKLAVELYEASQNRGASVKKREDTHKMAEANRAFAHFRW